MFSVWSQLVNVFMFLYMCVCVCVNVCVGALLCVLFTQQEINWLRISGHPGKKKDGCLIKNVSDAAGGGVRNMLDWNELTTQFMSLPSTLFGLNIEVRDSFFSSCCVCIKQWSDYPPAVHLAGMMSPIQGDSAASTHSFSLSKRTVSICICICHMEKHCIWY